MFSGYYPMGEVMGDQGAFHTPTYQYPVTTTHNNATAMQGADIDQSTLNMNIWYGR